MENARDAKIIHNASEFVKVPIQIQENCLNSIEERKETPQQESNEPKGIKSCEIKSDIDRLNENNMFDNEQKTSEKESKVKVEIENDSDLLKTDIEKDSNLMKMEKGKVLCMICVKEFNTMRKARRHNVEEHLKKLEESKYSCLVCDSSFAV